MRGGKLASLPKLVKSGKPGQPSLPLPSGEQVHRIALGLIRPNPHQPRQAQPDADLDSLVASVREHGILEPLLVRSEADGYYTLIDGHRRFEAARAADLPVVRALVRAATDEELLTLALVKNLQREDLHPVDVVRSVAALADQGLKQHEIGERLGKTREWVAQYARLAKLGDRLLDKYAADPECSLQGLISSYNWLRSGEESSRPPAPEPPPSAPKRSTATAVEETEQVEDAAGEPSPSAGEAENPWPGGWPHSMLPPRPKLFKFPVSINGVPTFEVDVRYLRVGRDGSVPFGELEQALEGALEEVRRARRLAEGE